MSKVYVYGAGKVGKRRVEVLGRDKISIDAFLVSEMGGNISEIDGVPVICIKDAMITADDTIIIAVSLKYQDEVKAMIKACNIHCDIVDDITTFIKKHRKAKMMALIEDCCQEDYNYQVESNLGYIGLRQVNAQGDICHFRVCIDEYVCDIEEGLKFNLLENFEQIYGLYRTVNNLRVAKQSAGHSVKILMACCHKDKLISKHITEDYIVPIQVGKALTDKSICEISDDTGINISAKNGNYCECTALYWAWKNKWGADLDYIGLCHYRRKIDITEDIIYSLKFNAVDIVLTAPTFIADKKKHFAMCTKNPHDWDIMKEAVNNVQSAYAEAFEIFENQHMVCQCNISIMRRDIFDEYCEFLFGVLEYVENYYDKIEPRNDRYLGYLAENLTSVFALKYKDEYKLAYGDMLIMQ